VILLINGAQITLHGVQEMLTEIVHPGALSSRTQIDEDLTEMREQLQKQLNRLRELRLKKIEEPGLQISSNLRLDLDSLQGQNHSMAQKMRIYKMLMP
jgi:hypothetical protein